MKLLLIRHAESEGNRQHRLQGRKDFPLTQLGRDQSAALARRVAAASPAAVYASPLLRAMETAQTVATIAGLDVIPEPRVQEYDFGPTLSGLTWPEIRAQRPQLGTTPGDNPGNFPSYPGEEGRETFRERVSEAFSEIISRHAADDAVAVVTHAGPIVVFLMDVLHREYSRPIPFSLDNASITTVEVNPKGLPGAPPMVVAGLNDTCHLHGLISSDCAEGSA